MTTAVNVLLVLLLTLTVVFISIQINNTLNRQANLIVELQKEKEGFTTPNNAWNMAASFMNRHNYLLTTAQNAKMMRDKPFYLSSTNQTRNVLPMNHMVPTKQAIHLPDDNSETGYRNEISFRGQLNPTALVRNKDKKKNETDIAIPGADIKVPNVTYDDNSSAVKQKPDVSQDDPETVFSVNNRANASAATALVSNESTAEKVLEHMPHTWRTVGSI